MKDLNLEVLMPMIRRIKPSLIADEIVGVQSLVSPLPESIQKTWVTHKPRIHLFGDIIHDFIRGYCIWDGSEFVSFNLFIKAHGTQEIKESGWKAMLCQWYYNGILGEKNETIWLSI